MQRSNEILKSIIYVTESLSGAPVDKALLASHLKFLGVSPEEYERVKANKITIEHALVLVKTIYDVIYKDFVSSSLPYKQKSISQRIVEENTGMRSRATFFLSTKIVYDQMLVIELLMLFSKNADDKIKLIRKLTKMKEHHHLRMHAIILIEAIRKGLLRRDDFHTDDPVRLRLMRNAYDVLNTYDDKDWRKDARYVELYKVLANLKKLQIPIVVADSKARDLPANKPLTAPNIAVIPIPLVDLKKDEVQPLSPVKGFESRIPRYKLIKSDLLKSKNLYIADNGVIYTFDKIKMPLSSLIADFERGLKINHKSKSQIDFKMDAENAFEQFLSRQFSAPNWALLKKHYSQAPAMILAAPFATVYNPMESDIILYQPLEQDRLVDVYEEHDDIYIRSVATRFPLRIRGELVGYLPGPVEVLFKLTNEGFEVQHIYTDSELIRDVFLKRSILPERIAAEVLLAEIKASMLQVNKNFHNDKMLNMFKIMVHKFWQNLMDVQVLLRYLDGFNQHLGQLGVQRANALVVQLSDLLIVANDKLKKHADTSITHSFGDRYFPPQVFKINPNKNVDAIILSLNAAHKFYHAKHMDEYKGVFDAPKAREALSTYEHQWMDDLATLARDVFLIRKELSEQFVMLGNGLASRADQFRKELDEIENAMIDAVNQFPSHYLVSRVCKEMSEKLKALPFRSEKVISILNDIKHRFNIGDFEFEADIVKVELAQLAERFHATPVVPPKDSPSPNSVDAELQGGPYVKGKKYERSKGFKSIFGRSGMDIDPQLEAARKKTSRKP